MKACLLKMAAFVLLLLTLTVVSGCIIFPWNWGGDNDRGGGHHEGHR